tara:strand:+ start:105 stop:617 length:513 start_codon:yes stop_codon:yes gene_type:complete
MNAQSEAEFCTESLMAIDGHDLERIKRLARESKNQRYRICIHENEKAACHEMFIAHTSKAYVRPHKHLCKGESLEVLEGQATAVFFDDQGGITNWINIGARTTELPFFYSLREPVFHTLLIHSELLVFKETTTGPFIREESIFADWAPSGDCSREVEDYISHLKNLTLEN